MNRKSSHHYLHHYLFQEVLYVFTNRSMKMFRKKFIAPIEGKKELVTSSRRKIPVISPEIILQFSKFK